jgi:pyruvate kinase
MNLIWGVRAFFYDEDKGTDETFEDLESILRDKGHLKSGDVLINTASMPLAKKQRTNTIRIDKVD